MLSFEDLQWADDVSLEIIAELARRSRDTTLLITGDYRTEEAAARARTCATGARDSSPSGSPRRSGSSRWIRARDGAGHDADPRHRPAGAARRRRGGLRADRRHPAAHRGAARRAQRRGAGRRHRRSARPRARDDRGRGHRADRPAVAGSAGDRAGRGGHRPVLRAGGPGRDHGPAAGGARGAAPGAGRPLRPGSRPASAGCTTSATSSCAMRSTGRSRPRIAAATTPEPASSGRGSRARRRSTRRVHYERAGLRREAFEAALAGAREAAGLSAHREAFELYRRAVENMPDDLDPTRTGADPGGTATRRQGRSRSIDIAAIARRCAAGRISAAGEPARAIVALTNELGVWRREGRPVSERLAAMRELRTELEALPGTPTSSKRRALSAFVLAIAPRCAGPCRGPARLDRMRDRRQAR